MIAFLDPPRPAARADCRICGGGLRPHPDTGRDYCPACVERAVTRIARRPPERPRFGEGITGRTWFLLLVLGPYLVFRMFASGSTATAPPAGMDPAALPFGNPAVHAPPGSPGTPPAPAPGGPHASAATPPTAAVPAAPGTAPKRLFGSSGTADLLLKKARESAARGDWPKAADYCRSALKIGGSGWPGSEPAGSLLKSAEAKAAK